MKHPAYAKLSEAQWRAYWRLWQAACRAQGWVAPRWKTCQVEAKRHELMDGLGFASAKDLDRTAGFDAWKALCGSLTAGPDGESPAPLPDSGGRRRLLHLIRRHDEPYVRAIARDKFGRAYGWPTPADVDLDALDLVEIRHLLFTLTARRRSAGAVPPTPPPQS